MRALSAYAGIIAFWLQRIATQQEDFPSFLKSPRVAAFGPGCVKTHAPF
jgi:hypothetical protein